MASDLKADGPAGTAVSGARPWLAACAAVALMAWAVYASCQLARAADLVVDDSYISYVYARNLSEGYGLRFNQSDAGPTEGFSSLLHVLAVAGTDRLGIHPVTATRGMSLLLYVLLPLVMGWAITRAVGGPRSVAGRRSGGCARTVVC